MQPPRAHTHTDWNPFWPERSRVARRDPCCDSRWYSERSQGSPKFTTTFKGPETLLTVTELLSNWISPQMGGPSLFSPTAFWRRAELPETQTPRKTGDGLGEEFWPIKTRPGVTLIAGGKLRPWGHRVSNSPLSSRQPLICLFHRALLHPSLWSAKGNLSRLPLTPTVALCSSVES